jgi:RNA polymerase sigma-70 factor (ECF subfamily)
MRPPERVIFLQIRMAVTSGRIVRNVQYRFMDVFRELYDRYYKDVHRFALFLTGDAARADDLTADTFVRAWRARDRIQHATVKAYLLAITRNLFRDELRASDLHVQHASTLRDVKARLRGVARGDHRALLLFVLKEMSYAEVAAALGISIGAVKSRINRAREALAASMRQLENGER